MIDYGLKGRVALVTGGSRGIGRAIASKLLEAGCAVAILSRHQESLDVGRRALEPLGQVLAVQADVTVRREVGRAVRTVEDQLGRVDVLVNNAGISSKHALMDIDERHWDDVMETNVRSMLFCCQEVAPGMMQRRWGRILNASSYAAWHPSLNRGAYAASKAAVIAVTRTWAGELAPFGITVNAYAPGDIETDIMAEALATQADQLTQRIALRRVGTPAEVAEVVVFLASERASYQTGITVEISGGKFVVQNPWEAHLNR